MGDRVFDKDEFLWLARELECHYSIFSRMWGITKPRFSDVIPTAAVAFDKVGNTIDFMINPDFWDKQSDIQKKFVVCHEYLHVALYHGLRSTLGRKMPEAQIANIAMDLVVNQMIVDGLGFDREAIDPANDKGGRNFCWVDNTFPDEKDRPPTDESFEFYYKKLMTKYENDPQFKQAMDKMSSMDSHDYLDTFIDKDFDDKMKQFSQEESQEKNAAGDKIKELAKEELAQQQGKEGLKQSGIAPGNSWCAIKPRKIVKKKKWETVVKHWARRYDSYKEDDQWVKSNRRYRNMSKDFMVPSFDETNEPMKERIQVWFFQDTSGSCSGLADRFFAAAQSLPTSRFDVKMHCFDTSVYKTSLKTQKLYGFGGTSFSCIELFIQQEMKQTNCKYPEAVFIITDGYGDVVLPAKPKKWYWFLSEDYKQYIPSDSKVYMLKDFE